MKDVLPSALDWHLVAHDPEWRCLTLTCGEAMLHLRFWPRASAALRLGAGRPWSDGSREAERLLGRHLRARAYGQVRLQGAVHPVCPDGQLHFPFVWTEVDTAPQLVLEQAMAHAIGRIPDPVRRRLQELHADRWTALRIASRIRVAAELFDSHPQLFWLWVQRYRLVWHGKYRGKVEAPGPGSPGGELGWLHAPVQPRHLFCLKFDLSFPRRIQLAKLGFAPEKFWLKLLAKVPLRHVHRIDWDGFAAFTRERIDPDALKQLQHARFLPVPLLQALADPRIRADLPAELVRDCLRHPSAKFYDWLRKIRRLSKLLPDGAELIRLPGRIATLEALAGTAIASLDAVRNTRGKRVQSPFSCPEGWTHLDTVEKLIEEGYRQANCLRRNAKGYLDAEAIVYRVERPVRATVHVDEGPGGHWYLRECFGRGSGRLPVQIRGELLRDLTAQPMPDLRTLPRKIYPASPAAGTKRYQRITNSRALWAFFASGKLHFHPDALEADLLAGRSAVYRLSMIEEQLIELTRDERYGWEFGRLLFQQWSEPSCIPFRLATHILWQHAAELHEYGLPAPAWTAPVLDLPGFEPVTDLWDLLRFNWDNGTCFSRRDIETGERIAFRCTLRGWHLAFTARRVGSEWRLARATARDEERLRQYHPLARTLIEEVEAALRGSGSAPVAHGKNPPVFSPPPPLPGIPSRDDDPFMPLYSSIGYAKVG